MTPTLFSSFFERKIPITAFTPPAEEKILHASEKYFVKVALGGGREGRRTDIFLVRRNITPFGNTLHKTLN